MARFPISSHTEDDLQSANIAYPPTLTGQKSRCQGYPKGIIIHQ